MTRTAMDASWIEERAEEYVDGTLSRAERRRFEEAIAGDPAFRSIVDQASRVKRALNQIRTPACPPNVTSAILERTTRNAHARQEKSPIPFWTQYILRPALAAAAVLALVAVLARPWERPEVPVAYSTPEVEQALDEVKWTLAYLNGMGSRTGATLRKEVFSDGVVRPIERGLGLEASRGQTEM